MKKIKKKILVIFALVLCLSVTVGVSMAYFSDYEDASGGATLNLGGKTELEEGNDHSKKDIKIKNTGETNMIVRVAILGEGVQYFKEGNPSYDTDDWAVAKDSQGVTWYYYKKVLKPKQETSVINAEMKFDWKGEEPDYSFEITVVHESAQAVYNGEKLATPDGWDDISEVIAPAKLPGEGE
jgi:predicted ribosomally synthesized peptide with SipW-like signal peptide